jgi:RNA polymerase sigma factor (TIGR02999 family)
LCPNPELLILGRLLVNEITQILIAIDKGDPQAAVRLMPLVYDELRRLAAAQMAQEKPGQTLDATALVHEAYLRLAGEQKFENRNHFFAAAAEAMRRILVENARRKGRRKRGGGRQREAVELDALPADIPDEDLLALHDALEQFAVHDPLKAQLVVLRFFGGMSLPEIAVHLGISLSTAERGWRYARAWLYAAMAQDEKSNPV